MSTSSRILVAALAAATSAWVVAPAAAAPIASPMMLQRAVDPSVETVRYYGHHHGGAGLGLGIAGALIGGAILGAATQPYGYYGYPGYPRLLSRSGPTSSRLPTSVATQLPIVCNASGPMTRIPAPILAWTASAILAPDGAE
jgi:hypothetical protein